MVHVRLTSAFTDSRVDKVSDVIDMSFCLSRINSADTTVHANEYQLQMVMHSWMYKCMKTQVRPG